MVRFMLQLGILKHSKVFSYLERLIINMLEQTQRYMLNMKDIDTTHDQTITMSNQIRIQNDDSTQLTRTLLYIRSLKKHSIDIKIDSKMFNSNLIALKET